MSNRLEQLTRQKKLLEEHILWLEQEIALERPVAPDNSPLAGCEFEASPTTSLAPSASAKTPSFPIETTTMDSVATGREERDIEEITDQLISRYNSSAYRKELDPRLGLLLYFGGALGFIALAVFLFYWFGYR